LHNRPSQRTSRCDCNQNGENAQPADRLELRHGLDGENQGKWKEEVKLFFHS
jgi:hypothetical protein